MLKNPTETIGHLIDNQKIGYLSSISNGYPKVRAMFSPRYREGIKYLYFTTNTSSKKIKEYEINPNACFYVDDKRFYRGISLMGKIELCNDNEIKKLVWRDGDEMYYPLGINDPDYTILKLTVTKGEYYANFKIEEIEL